MSQKKNVAGVSAGASTKSAAKSKKKIIEIYDTSLRDGLQGEKVKLNLRDKLVAVEALDKLGVDYIEGGFPLASENESEFFKKVRSLSLKNSKIAAFGSTRKAGGRAKTDGHIKALLQAESPVVTVVGKSWTKHVTDVIQTTLKENLQMIEDSVSFLKDQGREVIYDAEHFFDGFHSDREYTLKTIKTAQQAGADRIILCDTNGGTTYRRFWEALEAVKDIEGMNFGVHLHDDTGCGVANSMMALDYGARHIQGTVNGWGERCGNANLIVILANLTLKTDYTTKRPDCLKHLTYVSRLFDDLANLPHNNKQAYTGKSAFAHKAGQHADVILKNSQLMEHIDAKQVGNNRRVLLSELAGKATVSHKMERFGNFDKSSKEVAFLTKLLKDKEQEGYEYESAEASFQLLIRKHLSAYREFFKLIDYGITIEKSNPEFYPDAAEDLVRAFVRVSVDGRESAGVSHGSGPVAALDNALRKALIEKYPFIDKVRLADYKVRVLNAEDASEAKVSVHVTSICREEKLNLGSWTTVGISANIIDASWQAITEAFEYAFNEKADILKKK